MAMTTEEKVVLACGLLTTGIFIGWIILAIIVMKKGERKIKQAFNGSTLKEIQKRDSNSLKSSEYELYDGQIQFVEFGGPRWKMAYNVVSLMFICLFEVLFFGLVMFDYLPIAAGIIIMLIVSFLAWGTFGVHTEDSWIHESFLYRIPKKFTYRFTQKLRNFKTHKAEWLTYLLVVAMIIALTVMFEGICENNMAIVDSRIIRRYSENTCKEGAPCYVYLTLTEHPESSVYVNYHTSNAESLGGLCLVSKESGIDSNYTANDSSVWSEMGSAFRMNIEVRRYIHYVLLDELDPDTTYYFRCGSKTYGFSDERKFKTSHIDPEKEFSFVVGGDMDTTPTAALITQYAGFRNPDFVMLGGDLAYDRAQYTCYRLVDKWLAMIQDHMVSTTGYVIPMVATIGNHEVQGDYGAPTSRIPFFTKYFAQSLSLKQTDDIKEIVQDRKTYNYVNYGGPSSMLIFNLDSGHSASLESQVDFMKSILSENITSSSIKVAIYHVPMYPTIRLYENSHSAAVRSNWLPLFDDMHLTVGFENHDHSYKRTYQMKNGELSNNGTIYMGDGAWGVQARGVPDSRSYQEFVKKSNYMTYFQVRPSNGSLFFRSFNENNEVFDSGIIFYK